MKLGLKCSTDPKVTNKVWLHDTGKGFIHILCDNFYLATLSSKGIQRAGYVPGHLGIATEDGKIKDIQ